jgi:hypothetical protein
MNGSLTNGKHAISLQTAVEMTARYRTQMETILAPEYRDGNLLCVSETFDRSAFDRLLAQPGCTALRIYYGMDEALHVHAIVVGVNEKDVDILPTETEPAGEIIDVSKVCPPFCSPSSPLNS